MAQYNDTVSLRPSASDSWLYNPFQSRTPSQRRGTTAPQATALLPTPPDDSTILHRVAWVGEKNKQLFDSAYPSQLATAAPVVSAGQYIETVEAVNVEVRARRKLFWPAFLLLLLSMALVALAVIGGMHCWYVCTNNLAVQVSSGVILLAAAIVSWELARRMLLRPLRRICALLETANVTLPSEADLEHSKPCQWRVCTKSAQQPNLYQLYLTTA